MMRTVAICAVLITGAVQAEAGVRRICNAWTDQCWLENEHGQVVRARHHKAKPKRRKPQVRAYVKREREDDDGVRCKETLVVIGDARPSESGARDDAEAVFMRASRFRHGEAWMDPRNARDYAVRCARASITEIVGQVMVRCELKAKPCRPPFESK